MSENDNVKYVKTILKKIQKINNNKKKETKSIMIDNNKVSSGI